MNMFNKKVAIVTGGASGIGRGICRELAGRGCFVVVADIDETGAKSVAAAITAGGGKAQGRKLDVRDFSQVDSCVKDVASEYGRLDYMFNNAGIGVGGEVRDMSLDHWRKIVDVNLWGVIHGVHAVYPVMISQGFGHIINTASLAGLVPLPCEVPYATTKYAVVGLSTSLRTEAESLGVKVSVVCPGLIDTAIFGASELVNADIEELLKQMSFKMTSPKEAAQQILAGVEKNQDIIIVTRHAKALLWIYRHAPGIHCRLTRKMISDFRKLRKEPK